MNHLIQSRNVVLHARVVFRKAKLKQIFGSNAEQSLLESDSLMLGRIFKSRLWSNKQELKYQGWYRWQSLTMEIHEYL